MVAKNDFCNEEDSISLIGCNLLYFDDDMYNSLLKEDDELNDMDLLMMEIIDALNFEVTSINDPLYFQSFDFNYYL